MEIETIADLKNALAEFGYSERAISEILKWYSNSTNHVAIS